jgi:hypothetical protein
MTNPDTNPTSDEMTNPDTNPTTDAAFPAVRRGISAAIDVHPFAALCGG